MNSVARKLHCPARMRRIALAVFTVVLAVGLAPFIAFEALVASVGHRLPAPRVPPDSQLPMLAQEAVWFAVGEEDRTAMEPLWLGSFAPRSGAPAGLRACEAVARQDQPRWWKRMVWATWLCRHARPRHLKSALVEWGWYGRNLWGFEAAARAWLGKSAGELSTAEIAFVASRFGAPRRNERLNVARWRRDLLLEKLHAAELITHAELIRAQTSELRLMPGL